MGGKRIRRVGAKDTVRKMSELSGIDNRTVDRRLGRERGYTYKYTRAENTVPGLELAAAFANSMGFSLCLVSSELNEVLVVVPGPSVLPPAPITAARQP